MRKLGNIRYIQKENFFSAWEDSESGYFYVIDIVGEAEDKPSNLSGNRFFGFQWKSGGKNFGYQLAFGFGTDKIAINRIINGAWSDWDYFVPKSYVDDKIKIIDSGNFAFDSTEANGNSQKVISFRKAFNTIPNVVICPSSTANPKGREMATIDVTKTGFTATLHNASGEVISPYATWIAIGS